LKAEAEKPGFEGAELRLDLAGEVYAELQLKVWPPGYFALQAYRQLVLAIGRRDGFNSQEDYLCVHKRC
jgi:hypothetical protein